MRKFFWTLSMLSCIFTVTYAEDNKQLSPIGYWKTIDDETGQPKAIVQIWQERDTLYGKITKLFPRPGINDQTICKACQGDKRNQRLIGLVILEKLKRSQENKAFWDKGEILDPKSGKVYHSNLSVSNSGNHLNVRGYLGVPLFGRTQTWTRVSNPQA